MASLQLDSPPVLWRKILDNLSARLTGADADPTLSFRERDEQPVIIRKVLNTLNQGAL